MNWTEVVQMLAGWPHVWDTNLSSAFFHPYYSILTYVIYLGVIC